MISSLGSFESLTRSRTARKTWSTISPSGLACPGGFTAAWRHCTMPPELLMVPFFSMKNAAGSRITSVAMDFGSTPGPLPERRRLRLPDLLDHERLELRHRVERQLEVGQRDRGILADDPEQLQLPGEGVLEHRQRAVVLGRVALGQPGIAVVVLGGGRVSEERLERVDEVPAVGDPVLAHVVVDRRLGVGRRVEVARACSCRAPPCRTRPARSARRAAR